MYESEPIQQSLLSWAFRSLGATYVILLPLVALLSFIFVVILLSRGRGPMAAASILLFVHTPLMIGLFAALQGMIASYQVIASSGSTPKPAEMAQGISMALIAPLVAILLMIPSYLAAAIGTLVRAISAKSDAN
jgi:hypothetical protein